MENILRSKTPMMVTKYAIGSYAGSIDNHQPIYYDEAAAKEAGFERVIAPSSFFGQLAFSKVILGQEDYIPTGGVHVKQSYKFFAVVKEGDKITLELECVRRLDEKQRNILEYHMSFINQDGQLVCQSTMVNMLNPV